MGLQIQTTSAILDTRTTKSQLSIQQPKASVEGSITQAQVRVEASLPKVQIDQNQAFNESGLKDNATFAADAVNFAFQKMSEGVARRAQQGDQLAKTHQGGNPIADQAGFNAYDQFQHQFGMVTMPRSGAQIDVIEGQLDIRVTEGEITGTIRAQKPILNHTPGKVERSMKQYNSISINYVEDKLDINV